MTALIACDRCGKQVVWPADIDGAPFQQVQIRFVGGPNALISEGQRDWRADLGAPHICPSCQQDFSEWMKAGPS